MLVNPTRAQKVRDPQHGFAQMAAVVVGLVSAGARFRVLKNGADHGLHVAAYAIAVVGEYGGNARHIRRAWRAGDQVLDELLANKRPHIGVVEDVGRARRAGPARRSGPRAARAIQERLGVMSCSLSTATIGAR